MEAARNYFSELYAVDVSGKIEKKNGLSYLSWPFCWAEVKKRHPGATFTIYERDTEFGPVNYFTDGRTCWVKTGVTIDDIEHIEELPVMDFKNRSIPYDAVTSMDINKSIQRSLTKACARHGLGLYVYAGEDLPEGAEDKKAPQDEPQDDYDGEAKANPTTIKMIVDFFPADRLKKALEYYGVQRAGDLTAAQAGKILTQMKKEGLLK